MSLLLSKRAHSDGGLHLGASFAASKCALMTGSNQGCACSLEKPSFSPPVSLTGFQNQLRETGLSSQCQSPSLGYPMWGSNPLLLREDL